MRITMVTILLFALVGISSAWFWSNDKAHAPVHPGVHAVHKRDVVEPSQGSDVVDSGDDDEDDEDDESEEYEDEEEDEEYDEEDEEDDDEEEEDEDEDEEEEKEADVAEKPVEKK